eukprot:PhF_6_TR29399/c1_g1_i1/m.43393/K15296/NAPA, SNAPA, SEC17; alpha-soluble NSF attachment protein
MSSGKELMAKAEAKLKGFMSMFNGAKYEEAADLFQRAAGKFKADSDFINAGEAFMRAGDISQKSGAGSYEACTNYSEAGACFRKAGDSRKALMCLNQSIHLYIEANRFNQAAKIECDLGDMFEELHELDQAVEHYKKSIQYFNTDDTGKIQAQKVALKVAMIHADKGDYVNAVKLFEQLAAECLAGTIKSAAREHYFKAALLRIPMIRKDNISEGVSVLREAIMSYQAMDSSLRKSREVELIEGICDGLDNGSADGLREAVQAFSEVGKNLDDWKINLIHHAMQLLEGEDER